MGALRREGAGDGVWVKVELTGSSHHTLASDLADLGAARKDTRDSGGMYVGEFGNVLDRGFHKRLLFVSTSIEQCVVQSVAHLMIVYMQSVALSIGLCTILEIAYLTECY